MKVWLRILANAVTPEESDGGTAGPKVTVEITSRLYVLVYNTEGMARAAQSSYGGVVLGVEAAELNQPVLARACLLLDDETPMEMLLKKTSYDDITVSVVGGSAFTPSTEPNVPPTPEQFAWMEQFEKESGLSDWTI